MKKSTICQVCSRKTDHRIKYHGRAICKNCLDWVNNKKSAPKLKGFDSLQVNKGELVETADGIVEIK